MSHSGFHQRFRDMREVGFRGLAENVATNIGYADPAGFAFSGWRRSPSHHTNMVSDEHPYTGIGVARGQDGSVYITHLFGFR
jgi:uncharacterized protein YkwD